MNFVRGMLRLLVWPLFCPSRWRAEMAALGLAPGAALFDLSFRRADHRKLGVQVLAWCICATVWHTESTGGYPLSLALGGWAEVATPILAILLMLTLGGSIAGGIALLSLLEILLLLLPIGQFFIPDWKAVPVGTIFAVAAATIVVLTLLRYPRNASLRQYGLSLLGAPFGTMAVWLPGYLLGGAVYVCFFVGLFVRSKEGLSEALAFLGYSAQSNLMTAYLALWEVPIGLSFLLLPAVRDVVELRARSRWRSLRNEGED